MKLSMDVIGEQLTQYRMEQILGEPSHPTLEGIRMLHQDIRELNPRYLYIGIAEDFQVLPAAHDHVTLLCCGPLPSQKAISDGYQLYCIQQTDNFGMVFNDVEEVFHRCAVWEQQLSELTTTRAELQQFIDISDPFFSYPLSMIDYSESTLAMSRQKNAEDPVWQDLRSGRIRTSFLQQDSIQARDLAGGKSPVELYSTGSRRYILIQPVNLNNHTVAFLSAHMGQEGDYHFSRASHHLLAVLTAAVTQRLRMDELYSQSMGKVSDFFIADLINRKTMDSATVEDRARFLSWEVKKPRRLLCIEGDCLRRSSYACKSANQHIQQLVRKCDSVVYQKCIVILEHGTQNTATFAQQYPLLLKWLQDNGCVCAVSNTFSSLEQLPDYYDQTQAALRYGRVIAPGEWVHAYCSYSYLHSLELLQHRLDLRSMIHPMVTRIFEIYGQDNVMVDTLKAYLRCERNITNAAKQLFIHRNSMVYRVEQLSTKLDSDFSDYNLRAELLYSLDILEYLQLQAKLGTSK